MDAMLEALKEAGFADAGARRANGAIHTYTIGSAALSRPHGVNPTGNRDDTEEVIEELVKLTTPA
jgi:hypothetical protein